MAVEVAMERKVVKEEPVESKYMKGVRHLCESGITRVPNRYIFPVSEQPDTKRLITGIAMVGGSNLKLPVVDLALLQTAESLQVLESLKTACENYGFFRVVNHGMPSDVIRRMMGVGKRFFELPFEERTSYMSNNIRAPVRYGTSFNQIKDGVFSWRDFLKLSCHPLESVLQYWPSSPVDLREIAAEYAKQTRALFLVLMGAILGALGLDDSIMPEFDQGTHMMIVNCFPACPEPNLTLGMPPHSDYGFLTLLLQDDVEGLEVQCDGEWVTVEPVPDSLVVNVGDHLEIFSNGRFKSALHRVLVNSSKSRFSIASLHSLPYERVISPSQGLVDDENPRLYKDTDFDSFLRYMAIRETANKTFLESRKLDLEN